MRVLVVEDEVRLADNLAAALREGPGFAVDCAEDGETGEQLARQGCYDLIVLDLMLPKVDGLTHAADVCARATTQPRFSSSPQRTAQPPSSSCSTPARTTISANPSIWASSSRAPKRSSAAARERRIPVLAVADIEVNTLEQTVRRAGRLIDLSPTEYRILEYLVHRPRVIVSKRELLEHLYDYNWEHHSNVIEAHISNLRKKLMAASPISQAVETLRGRGYRLVADQILEAGSTG